MKTENRRMLDERFEGSHCTHQERMQDKTTKFLSRYKSAQLFTESDNGFRRIIFVDGIYETSQQAEIKFIRELPNFDDGNTGDFFEGKYPEWYKEELKVKNRYVTTDAMLYAPGED